MTFNPLPKKLLIEPIADETTINGIIITTKKNTKYHTGKALAVGAECDNIKVGDTVIFNPRGTTAFGEYLVADYEEILGVLA